MVVLEKGIGAKRLDSTLFETGCCICTTFVFGFNDPQEPAEDTEENRPQEEEPSTQ